MAHWLIRFLTNQGQIRERDLLRQRVDQLLGSSASEEPTIVTTYIHEIERARDELHSGRILVALARLTKLLARIEALPDGGVIRPGSYEHSNTLQLLGQCLREAGQYADAWQHLQRALDLLNALLEQEPENPILPIAHANLLGDLGRVRLQQGDYPQAQAYLEQALQEHHTIEDPLSAIIALAELDAVLDPDMPILLNNPWYVPGQYAFVLKNIEPIDPIPWRGQRRIFQVPLSVFSEQSEAVIYVDEIQEYTTDLPYNAHGQKRPFVDRAFRFTRLVD